MVDTVLLFSVVASYGNSDTTSVDRAAIRGQTVTYMVKAIDAYLIAAILVIFAIGLYELFVSRIDLPEDAGFIARELQVKSLDELKNRILRLVLVVLIKELGLLARAVFVLDRKGKVVHAEYVPEVTQEPNYDAALAAVKAAM